MASQFTQVAPGYRHELKLVIPHEPLQLGDARLKCYEIAPRDTPVPKHLLRLATDFLLAESRAAHWELREELGFVLLHRCGVEFYFLIICSWRDSNELWETVYFKENNAIESFAVFPRERRHKASYCVWELGVICHEKQAWERFLRSSRTAADQSAYLNDPFVGLV
jgi:hypothetical protein